MTHFKTIDNTQWRNESTNSNSYFNNYRFISFHAIIFAVRALVVFL